ncbi:type I DNA topoisomerase [Halanaerobacter jeridensis]|uniref:DNA topoisomerase 1 n=1 Tax=Halanaerobacter jeridensis TaxID=706427 RepID=A0A938XPW8_9FIRM|nr:type I DNA topoisomerase [Halanaerobacter jeridensis]MBM7555329.1 DNA topoisomerase-1 [Halanaerobacter jeridensis]
MAKKKKQLVIVESPAKAKTISKFLGREYTVEASMGHLIDLPKSQLGVDVEENFEPKYITIRGKGKILQKLRRKAKKSKKVLLATDPDREGEAISWHLSNALKVDEENKCRIEFNEITEAAVQQALENPRSIDKDRVDAQQARRVLDRLVGYKLSPLLWKKVRKGLSAGRVQSVALRIICEREDARNKFEPEEYWTAEINLKNPANDKFSAKLYRINNQKYKLKNEQEAKELKEDLQERKLKVSKIKEGQRRRNPAAPFTTSSLQQQAANSLYFSAKKTMFVAQRLYEGVDIGAEGTVGLITYMRTDSTRIAKEAQTNVQQYVLDEFGEKYLAEDRNYKVDSKAQDAHEAIRPTSVFRTPQKMKEYLDEEQYKLYKLIWERFVASQMAPALYKTLRVNIKSKNGKYLLRANGSQQLFAGVLQVDQSREQKEDTLLPNFNPGDKIELSTIKLAQHFTNPPARYTEAKLVKTLKKEGIGRPSTYATIIGTIQDRDYVEKEGKKFKPTELGAVVNGLLVKHFPNVTDVEFTAQMEDNLDKVEAGTADWREILSEFYFPFQDKLEEAHDEMEEVDMVEETDEICEKCGRNMVIKYGRYGKFLACPGFPECKNTKPFLVKAGVECPRCEDGEVIERKSKKGRRFYGCSNYPECEFMTWDHPTEEECPECGSFLVEKKRKNKTIKYCIDEDCKYETIELS